MDSKKGEVLEMPTYKSNTLFFIRARLNILNFFEETIVKNILKYIPQNQRFTVFFVKILLAVFLWNEKNVSTII